MTTNKDNGIWQKIKEESFEPCPGPMGGGIKMDDCRVIDLDDLKPIIDDLLSQSNRADELEKALQDIVAQDKNSFNTFGSMAGFLQSIARKALGKTEIEQTLKG